MQRTLSGLGLVLTAGALLGGACGPPAPTSLVPSDYRARFTRVRDCRATIEHTRPNGVPVNPIITNIAVYVNPESAAAYMANANPLPANTLVVKEASNDPDCATAVAWSVMRKEGGDYDPTRGNWRYQHVLRAGTIDADGRVETCIGRNACHSASECVMRDFMCTAP